MYFIFFFFSSRRRHTRLVGDWSSDVCSSDLARKAGDRARHLHGGLHPVPQVRGQVPRSGDRVERRHHRDRSRQVSGLRPGLPGGLRRHLSQCDSPSRRPATAAGAGGTPNPIDPCDARRARGGRDNGGVMSIPVQASSTTKMAREHVPGTASLTLALVGSGGVGVALLGYLVLKLAARQGLYGMMVQSYGPQIRGGESAAIVRLARDEIQYEGGRTDLL